MQCFQLQMALSICWNFKFNNSKIFWLKCFEIFLIKYQDPIEKEVTLLNSLTLYYLQYLPKARSICPEVSCKKGILKKVGKLKGKHLYWSLFFSNVEAWNPTIKETPVQVFSCEFWKAFKNIFFVEHLWRAAFGKQQCLSKKTLSALNTQFPKWEYM